MEILFNNNTQEKINESTYELIEKAVKGSLDELNIKAPVEVSITITDNSDIRQLNNEYRDKDSETDVLSFPMIDMGKILTDEDLTAQRIGEHNVPIGDIVISYEKAKEQALEYGHSIERETAFLTVHSMLHLFGYDHLTQEEETDMFNKQEIILEKMGLSREGK